MIKNNQQSKRHSFRVNTTRGFTLVETLVAITILLVAIVGPMSAISSSLSQMSLARDQMTAINLAQEGIEAVRQKRDSNVLEVIAGVPGSNWMKDLNQPHYTIDGGGAFGVAVDFCPGSCDLQPVFTDVATGFYRQEAGTLATQFFRKVSITGGGTIERKIISTVEWQRGSAWQEVVISESLFNWTN